MKKAKFIFVFMVLSSLAFLGGCDLLLSNTDSDEYDTWYYKAEGFEGPKENRKRSAISITHGITDIDGWTIDTGDVGAVWRSKTYSRLKNLARLDIGFLVTLLDLHNETEGCIKMSIYVNNVPVNSGSVEIGPHGMTAYASSILGDPTGYSVIYRGNWTTGGYPPVDDNIYREGDPVVIKSNEGNLQRIGSKLTGWNTQSDGNGQSWDFGDVGIMPDGNVVLYAEWMRESQ